MRPRISSRLRPGDRVIVCGAGPAGLTAAYLLAKQGHEVTVLESDAQVGGLSRTVQYKNFRFDIGGHRFFTKIPEVQALWDEVLGDELLDVPRLSRIHYAGKYFQYPLRAADALGGLGLWQAALIVLSYIKARLRPDPVEDNFEQWVSNRFGSRLYRIFFKTYTEKVWGLPCTEIRAEWAAQRIQGLSLARAILSATSPNRRSTEIKTLIHAFKYPRLGPGQMWELCQDRVADLGSRVLLRHRVNRIELSGGRVRGLSADTPEGPRHFEAEHIISTMPLRSLIRAAGTEAPERVRLAAEALSYRDFLLVALILDREGLFPDNWVYIHTPGVKVGRIQNYNNWSSAMVPEPGRTCLGMEYFCFKGDGLWESGDDELIALATRELNQLALATGASVVDGTVVRVPKAYPIYDLTYRSRLEPIRDFLDGIPNLHTVGRNGMHKYNNQDHSMYTAMLTVENLHGAGHDVWEVNTDFDYHEEQRTEQGDAEERPALELSEASAFVEADREEGPKSVSRPTPTALLERLTTANGQPGKEAIERFAGILLLAHTAQTHPPLSGDRRGTDALLSPLLMEADRFGLAFTDPREGPWWVGCDHCHPAGRAGDLVIPTVTRGRFRLRVSDFQIATRLAGFLSWCDVPEPSTAPFSMSMDRQRPQLA
jgi:protoporphyrinogen oxidase